MATLEIPNTPFSSLYFDVAQQLTGRQRIEIIVGKNFTSNIDFSWNKQITQRVAWSVLFVIGFLYGIINSAWTRIQGGGRQKEFLVGVRSGEGIDLDKRSDIFWYPKSGLNSSDVIIYFEYSYSSQDLTKDRIEQTIRWDRWCRDHADELNRNGFRYITPIKLRLLRAYQPQRIRHRYRNILKLLSNRKTLSRTKLEKYGKPTYRLAKYFIREVKSWHGVFFSTGMKIHWEATQTGVDTIIKSVALTEVGGVSLGKERSFTVNNKGHILGNYPNDVFFVWGEESARRIQKSVNGQKSIVISGLPYDSRESTNRFRLMAKNEVSRMRRAGVKFIILLLDNSHDSNDGSNDGLQQVIYTESLTDFYSKVLEWVLKEPDVGLIIKSKKRDPEVALPRILDLITKLRSSNRCYNVESGYLIKPTDLSPFADMVIATGVFFPGALVETVLGDVRGVFFDYPNLEKIEEEFYSWGKDQVIYGNLDRLLADLERFKQKHPGLSKYGSWEGHIDKLDPYRDGRGGERIGFYVNELLKELSTESSIVLAIERVNRTYTSIWGASTVCDVS